MTGKELKAARKLLGMTVEQLAAEIGGNTRTINGWEQGRSISGIAEKAIRDLMKTKGV
ncbi:MAG: helix-turn-helix domain-containing protein [Shewanella sp.]|uniref:helix-turn-helix domain-containing protein n=1 Tax=Aeromonas popoffii TaxID=70856 RepID=UPI003F3FB573